MEVKKEDLTNWNKLCFHYALYKTGNLDCAKDIAAQTMNLFLLKKDILKHTNIRGWIIKTCNNYCKKHFEKVKKNQKLTTEVQEQIHDLLYQQLKWEKDISLLESFQLVWDKLTHKELRTLLFFFHCKSKIKTMSEISGENYASLRKRISRIKKKIQGETYQKMGYIATQKIITPQMNHLITNFLKRFKEKLETKQLHTMHYYFSEIDLRNYNPDLEIEKIIDYRVNLFEKIYTAYVFYQSKNGSIDSFYIKFKIDQHNHLKILQPPTRTKKITKINKGSAEFSELKKLLHQYPENHSGISTLPKELLEKILKKKEA